MKFKVGDSVRNIITIPKNQTSITISGWMFKEGVPLRKATRKIALKKKNNFIFISRGDLRKRPSKYIAKRFGENYLDSGYDFNINKNSLEKGKYKIYNIIEFDKGEIFIKDMWKWLIIE